MLIVYRRQSTHFSC